MPGSVRKVFLVLTQILIATIASNTHAIFIRADVPVSEYMALTQQHSAFDAAGYVLLGLNTPTLQICSGTLIGPTQFLTAAHCVKEMEQQPEKLYVGFGDNFPPFTTPLSSNVSQIKINPAYTSAPDEHDMAILQLINTPQIMPLPLITLNPIGSVIAFKGYGLQGTSGSVLSSGFTPMPGASNGLAAFNMIEKTDKKYFKDSFNAPGSGALRLEGIGGPGDSGTGALISYNKGGQVDFYLIGVLEGGSSQIPSYGTTASWTRIRENDNLAFLKTFPGIRIEEINISIPEPGSITLALIALLSLTIVRLANSSINKHNRYQNILLTENRGSSFNTANPFFTMATPNQH